MVIPAHYKRLYLSFLKLACWMVFFGLTAGILFQESSRKVPVGKLAPGIHWESVYHLALLHGHVLLIGVVVPVAVITMLQFGLMLDGKVVSEKLLKWGGRLYAGGTGVSVLLMLYKGYHYLISVRMGQMDFAVIEQGLFGGEHIIRAVVYGVAHTAMSAGLITLAVGILRSLPKSATTE